MSGFLYYIDAIMLTVVVDIGVADTLQWGCEKGGIDFPEGEDVMGCVFDIQRFSLHDGPGIRTTVFLKGCPLQCRWCHNPESKRRSSELLFDQRKCLLCGACTATCPTHAHALGAKEHTVDRARCVGCGACAAVCPTGCLELVGTERTVDEVLREVMRDAVFYQNSGGGITLSGGEPLLQFDFTYSLLAAAKARGLHTCLETCGFADAEKLRRIAPLVDIFLYDYKESDRERHRAYTGVYNEQILANLAMLDETGCSIILRCPIIPTLNDRTEHLEAIARLAEKLYHVTEIHVEPYHALGVSKSARLGEESFRAETPDEETVTAWVAAIAAHTHVPVRKA
ncbi:MAG: glycyl-radical enzyme activating protein [Ruminococcaceae bacterium]|nr:glycyl-radical enzyme activating protein [Oscillospiraceae bacterium]